MQSAAVADRHCVRPAVTRDRHSARRVSRSAQRQGSLKYVESLKYGLRHALSIRLGVQKSFRERNRMFFARDFLHVGPIRDDTVLNGILQLVAGRSSRGAAPAAIAAGEFSHGGRPPGSSL